MTELIQKETQKHSLPHGWATGTIEDLIAADGVFLDGDWVESKDQDPGGDVRLTQLADVGDGTFRDRSSRFLTSDKAQQLGCTFLRTGDLLIARMPDPLGRACIFPGDRRKSVTVVDVCVVRAGTADIDHRWLMHFINSPAFRMEVAALQSGSTRKRISRKNLAKIELPVPPSREQRRIVEKIEELFTKLDAGVRSLEQTRAQLKSYRRSVLKAAVEGELSREWREAHRDELEPASELLKRILQERREKFAGKKYKEPASPDTSKLPVLPDGWEWANVDQISREVRYGSSAKTNEDPTGIPVMRMGNIQNGQLVADKLKYLPTEHDEFPGLFLEPGDLLFNRTNSYELVGKTAVYSGTPEPCSLASYLIRVRFLSSVLSEFVAYFINSAYGRQWISSVVSQQVGQANVNGTKLKALVVPLPPAREQRFIVEEVERRLSVVDKLEETVEANLKQAGSLRQSILKQAFSGELVPQNPDDEPASALLARIKEERRAKKPKASKKSVRAKRKDATDEWVPELFPEQGV